MISKEAFGQKLVDELATFTSKPVGLGEAPVTDGAPSALPYYIVYTAPDEGFGGPDYADTSADPSFGFQFTAAALGARQQLWMEDRIDEFVLGRDSGGAWLVDLDGTGWKVMGREFDSDLGGTVEGGVYTAARRFQFKLTPA